MAPIVFVHGLIGPLCTEEIVTSLASVPVLAPDLPGYGPAPSNGNVSVEGQVEALAQQIAAFACGAAVHLVGHSVGAVTAAMFAHRDVGAVASLTSVEGNFSIADAFWSAQLAAMTISEVRRVLEHDRRDPAEWLRRAGIVPTEALVARAQAALGYQEAETLWAMAKSVVDFTSGAAYPTLLRQVFIKRPVHLLAGERSVREWRVPGWARATCASWTVLPRVGHMMNLEDPAAFGSALHEIVHLSGPQTSVRYSS